MGLLDGKIAVVTGAGGGLGRAYALLFAREGARVVVNDLGCRRDGTGVEKGMAQSVVEEIRASGGIAVPNTDSVSMADSAKRIVETALREFGGIDILVNNAGILRDKTLLKMEEEMWDMVIDVHLKGTFLCGRAAARAMKEQGRGGRIINTTSIAGLMGNFGQTNYAAAKGGIYSMTLVWSKELARYGIGVNAVAPIAKTRMTEDIDSVSIELKPDMVAPCVLFLASDLSKDVTGRILGVHGRHIFEYKMCTSKGIEKAEGDWIPAEIAEKLEIIGKFEEEGKSEGEKGEVSLEQEVDSAFSIAPLALVPERAESFEGVFQFKITGAKDKTITVSKGKVSVEDGLSGVPACIVEVDAGTISGMFKGRIKGEKAFMEGKIKASNIPALIKFSQIFDFRKAMKERGEPEPGREEAKEKRPPAPEINMGVIGKKYRGRALLVKAEEIRAYALATNDPNPFYLDEGREDGIVAPPVFPVRLLRDLLFEVLMDKEIGLDLARIVHGEQDIILHSYLKPGDLISPRAVISNIEEKSTGYLVKVDQILYREGIPVVEMYSGFFQRGEKRGEKQAPSEEEERKEILFEVSMKVTADQSLRYADASGDHNPIHVNSDAAKAAGLPDVILQGLCTMAFTGRAVISALSRGNPLPLRRLRVRFSRYVLMGDELLTRGWYISEKEGVRTIGFETMNQKGEKVITAGIAEIRD